MPDIVETIKNVLAVVGPIIGGGGVWAYMSERERSRPPLATSVADSQSEIAEQTRIILAEHTKDRDDLRRIVVKQGKRITKLAANVAECNRHHQNCEENLSRVRAQLDKMMGDPAAPTLVINPHPLKD